ncbi:MAG: hypothetical protein M1832_003789 [Thelocarpon impressellum]|nr:MAG: hypothetical protein M1832_003789 [Thelocarpon impressellum]
MSLPFDIRAQVYEHLLVPKGQAPIEWHLGHSALPLIVNGAPSPRPLGLTTAILATSRAVNVEATPVLYERNHFFVRVPERETLAWRVDCTVGADRRLRSGERRGKPHVCIACRSYWDRTGRSGTVSASTLGSYALSRPCPHIYEHVLARIVRLTISTYLSQGIRSKTGSIKHVENIKALVATLRQRRPRRERRLHVIVIAPIFDSSFRGAEKDRQHVLGPLRKLDDLCDIRVLAGRYGNADAARDRHSDGVYADFKAWMENELANATMAEERARGGITCRPVDMRFSRLDMRGIEWIQAVSIRD